MISDTHLLRIAVVASIIGLGLIYIASIIVKPVQISPGNVSTTHIGETVSVTGTATDVSWSDGHQFFHITGRNGSVTAMV